MSTSEGKCVLVEVGALISWCIYSYRIVMLLVPYMWASMTFLPNFGPLWRGISVGLDALKKLQPRSVTQLSVIFSLVISKNTPFLE